GEGGGEGAPGPPASARAGPGRRAAGHAPDPRRATSRLSMKTNCIWPVPVALAISAVVVGPVMRTPAAWSARGLMTVLSAPVSNKSLAPPLPLIIASTMMRWPGTKRTEVSPDAFSPGRPGAQAGGAGAAGAFFIPRGTAFER